MKIIIVSIYLLFILNLVNTKGMGNSDFEVNDDYLEDYDGGQSQWEMLDSDEAMSSENSDRPEPENKVLLIGRIDKVLMLPNLK